MADIKENIAATEEEKRLRTFEHVAKSWDQFPEYAQGKIDGIIEAYADIYLKAANPA